MQSKCNALEPTLPNPDKEWEPVPVTSNAERPLPTARGNVAGRYPVFGTLRLFFVW